ncbi:MAG: hypothetical protein QNJ47_26315 [Nostocaceae cyanobacterium]|nr:hypothetical protein [Nostocaceae cyanobacterium]
MNLKLNIEQIILEGVDLPRSQRSRLQAAVETELLRLLSENGLPPHLQGGGTIPNLPATVNVTKGMKPEQMGREIAQSIYGGMVNEASGIPSTAK